MISRKPRIVIIGAGMAGLTAANKLYTCTNSKQLFELTVVEGGSRIGGRINSSEFCGDGIEQGATWIHGIEGSPVYRIAQERSLLHSPRPWECMDEFPDEDDDPVTIAEGGHELDPSIVEPISSLFKNLMNCIRGKALDEDGAISEIVKHSASNYGSGSHSVGSFLREGLEAYWGLMEDQKDIKTVGNWSRKSLQEAIFAMHENMQRSFAGADDLRTLAYNAETEYKVFPGEEITIARGYSSVVDSLASVLPLGMIQLGRKVDKIEWHLENGHDNRPVKLHFHDGSTLSADHVIVTVSLGVLKHGICRGCSMFNPPLPNSKAGSISRLGYGVVNKVFLQLPSHYQETNDSKIPFLQMVFHQPNSELRHPKIPQWIRGTALLYPIYTNSRVVVSWLAGHQALELESLSEEDIINGFSTTSSNLLSSKSNWQNSRDSGDIPDGEQFKFAKVLRTQWGTNPLFLGSYSYVAVGSNGDDMDILAEPLPQSSNLGSIPQLQILFAGEATHRTYYSTTHGAYLSGIREANRLLDHYNHTSVWI